MSPFLSGGDALWALAIFVGTGLCFRHGSTVQVTLIALGFAWGIEFSQLYHAPWLDQLRSSLPERLVLGSTFNAPDLLAYVVGIVIAISKTDFRKEAKKGLYKTGASALKVVVEDDRNQT